MAIERGRAWRRFVNKLKKGKGTDSSKSWKPEKKWRLIYLRSRKLQRAKQLRIEYPRKNYRQIVEKELSLND